MKKLAMIASAMVIGFAAPALASGGDTKCDSAGGKWMSKQEARAKVEAMGYATRKVKEDDGCYEVYATKNGVRYEVFIHPVTGKVVKTKKKS